MLKADALARWVAYRSVHPPQGTVVAGRRAAGCGEPGRTGPVPRSRRRNPRTATAVHGASSVARPSPRVGDGDRLRPQCAVIGRWSMDTVVSTRVPVPNVADKRSSERFEQMHRPGGKEGDRVITTRTSSALCRGLGKAEIDPSTDFTRRQPSHCIQVRLIGFADRHVHAAQAAGFGLMNAPEDERNPRSAVSGRISGRIRRAVLVPHHVENSITEEEKRSRCRDQGRARLPDQLSVRNGARVARI
jgi:hypothetical protein